jgi:hypothetical protein
MTNGVDTKYGKLITAQQVDTVFEPEVLAGIQEQIKLGTVSMTRSIGGVPTNQVYHVSGKPEGLFNGEVQDMGDVKMEEDPLWSLEEQHRVILAGLGGI